MYLRYTYARRPLYGHLQAFGFRDSDAARIVISEQATGGIETANDHDGVPGAGQPGPSIHLG